MTTDPTASTELPSVEDLFTHIADLAALWREFIARPMDLKTPDNSNSQATIAAVFGLSAHTVEVADAIAQLHRIHPNRVVLMPLVRTAFECSLTAHWLAQIDDATHAWSNEHLRKAAAVVDNLENANSAVFRDGADAVRKARIIGTTLPTDSQAQARNFEQMCRDLAIADADAYVYYRLVSELTHPSVTLADQYVDRADDGTIILRRTPKFDDARSWLFLATASVVWALKAVDYSDKTKFMKPRLHQIAVALGIREALLPSAAALSRTR